LDIHRLSGTALPPSPSCSNVLRKLAAAATQMSSSSSPAAVVQTQLDAYNAKDVSASSVRPSMAPPKHIRRE